MKHLKSYEKTNEDEHNQPQVGDYIIVYLDAKTSPNMESFTNNKIGKVIYLDNNKTFIEYDHGQKPPINVIKYFDLNMDTNKWYIWVRLNLPESQIKYISSHNIEDIETIVNSNKYNL